MFIEGTWSDIDGYQAFLIFTVNCWTLDEHYLFAAKSVLQNLNGFNCSLIMIISSSIPSLLVIKLMLIYAYRNVAQTGYSEATIRCLNRGCNSMGLQESSDQMHCWTEDILLFLKILLFFVFLEESFGQYIPYSPD